MPAPTRADEITTRSTPTALRAGKKPSEHGLALLTESRAQTARRCAREEQLRYQLGIVPVAALSEKLRLGTLGHHSLEERWNFLGSPDELSRAMQTIAGNATDDSDPYEVARLEELIRGYCIRWEPDRVAYEVIGAELEFHGPLINPETGAASRTFQRAGKIDVLVRERATGRGLIIEHKFSGEDISASSSFWARLRMGGQSAGYIRGAELLGHPVDGVLYDVIAKSRLRPLKATPPESRKYTKATKTEPARLYANQREIDETVDEYRVRVREDIATNPDAYYQRGLVVRLDEQMREHDLEMWQLGVQLREQHRLGIAPRNPDACQRFGDICGYFPACCGEADINGHMFRRLDWVHPELATSQESTS